MAAWLYALACRAGTYCNSVSTLTSFPISIENQHNTTIAMFKSKEGVYSAMCSVSFNLL